MLHCGLTRDAPAIDGDLSDACWRLAGQAVDFLELSEERTRMAAKQTVVYALWNRETLFLGARCQEKSPDQIVRVAGRQAYENDCVEFFILPEGARAFHQFSVDTLPGNLYEGRAGGESSGGGARSAARIGRDEWSLELAVPFATLGRAPAVGEHWSLNIGREDGEARTLSIWAPASRFQDTGRFGVLRFVSHVPDDRRLASHVGVLDQVVSNADFAPGPDGLPRGWTVSRPHVRVAEITFQSGQWELVCRGGPQVVAEQSVRLRPGRSYRISVRARSPDGAGMVVVLSQQQEGGSQETELISAAPTPAFAEYTRTFVAVGGAGVLSIRRPAAQGEIALDRVSIRPGHAFTVTGLGLPACDMPLTPPVTTDHLTWAKPLSGGPITALFSMHYKYDGARDFVELAQRVDLDYDILMGGKAAEDPVRVNRRLGNDEYAVFVVSCTRGLPDALRDLILDRVEAGRGLVLVENTSCWSSHFVPDDALTTVGPDHYLRRDLALDALPDILDRVDAGRWGRGRVVVLRFNREKSYFYNTWPAERGEPAYLRREYRFWEGWQALIARSLAWAARRDSEQRITCSVDGRTVSARLATAEPGTRLRVRIRSGRELRFDGTRLPAVSGDGTPDVRVQLPDSFPDGSLMVDAFALDRDARIRTWSCHRFETPRPVAIETMSATRDYYEAGDAVGASVTVSARETCDAILRCRGLDAWGRVTAQRSTPLALVAGKSTSVDVMLDISRTLSTSNRLFASVTVNGREADSAWVYAYLPHVTRRAVTADWHTTGWAAGWCSLPVYAHYCDALRALGINDQMGEYASVENGMCGGRVEAPPRHLFDSYVTGGEKDRSHVRKPCLSDPDTRAVIRSESRRYGAEMRRYGLFGVYIAGEAMVCAGAGKTGIHEVCFSPFCEARYRRWLAEQYGDIDGLNPEWGTGHTDFSECRGMLTGAARKRANPAPFVDFRGFMADVWSEGMRTATDAYRQVDPGLRVGYSHCFGPVTLGATDFYRIATGSGFGWGQEYPECRKSQARYAGFRIWRSFYPSDWPDLAWTGYDHSRAALEYEPWWLALHGSRGLSYFSVNSVTQGRSYACVFPTLANTQASLWMRDTLKDLVGGVGKLMMEFDREPARIGILWSFPSLSVAWCESDLDYWQASEGPDDRSYGSWYKSAYYFRLLCEENQLDYRYVAAQELLDQGVLKQLDMLFLPAAIAVSPALIDALTRYVEAGGTVLGDWRCCRTDGHGKPYPLSAQPVERLFGVRRTRPDASYGPRTIAFTGDHPPLRLLGASMPGTCAEALEAAPEAKALAAHADGTPAVVVKEAGRGRTVYLNLVLPKYDVVARELIRQTAAWAGVPRPVVVEGEERAAPPRAYCVARFARGGNRVVGVVRDHRLCRDEEPVRITFDADAHLYDVRERRYVGLARTVETRIRPAQTCVYALLPYKVTGMTLDVSRSIVAGTDLEATAGIATESGAPGPHVFRVEVTDPHGELVFPYCRNVLAEAGSCTVTVPVALNDTPGTWAVDVRDVLTGVSRGAEFEVATPEQAGPPDR